MKRKQGVLAALAAVALGCCVGLKAEEAAPAFAHERNSFSLTVHAPYRTAAALFGPDGERAWSEGHWDPKFFYPQPGNDVPGAVFAIQHEASKAIWVTTAFDLEARHFQYVYFLAETLVTTIDLNFVSVGDRDTRVTVVYTRTALSPAANEHVRVLGEHDRKNGPHWEAAINNYLRTRHE